MRHTGKFEAEKARGDEWAGYEVYAWMCERAELTNRQAEVVLLYCRGCSYGQIQAVLGIEWKHVWRDVHRAIRKLEAAFPNLRDYVEHVRDRLKDDSCSILHCMRGLEYGQRPSRPLVGQREGGGLRVIARAPRLVTAADLGWHDVGLLDIVECLRDREQELLERALVRPDPDLAREARRTSRA